MEDIVAEYEADGVVADEFLSDDKGLCQTVGRWLLGIFETDAELAAVAEESAEAREVVGSGDDENLTNAGKHQNGDGVIDHRLVVDGNQLFADAFGDGVEAGAAAACQDYSFHLINFEV